MKWKHFNYKVISIKHEQRDFNATPTLRSMQHTNWCDTLKQVLILTYVFLSSKIYYSIANKMCNGNMHPRRPPAQPPARLGRKIKNYAIIADCYMIDRWSVRSLGFRKWITKWMKIQTKTCAVHVKAHTFKANPAYQ